MLCHCVPYETQQSKLEAQLRRLDGLLSVNEILGHWPVCVPRRPSQKGTTVLPQVDKTSRTIVCHLLVLTRQSLRACVLTNCPLIFPALFPSILSISPLSLALRAAHPAFPLSLSLSFYLSAQRNLLITNRKAQISIMDACAGFAAHTENTPGCPPSGRLEQCCLRMLAAFATRGKGGVVQGEPSATPPRRS